MSNTELPEVDSAAPIDTIDEYAARGFSCIPVRPDKRPLFGWSPFQEHAPSPSTREGWRRSLRAAGISIVTGAVSGIVVLDVDSRIAWLGLIKERRGLVTPTVKTPRGWHLYFKHPGVRTPNSTNFSRMIDFRGDGGYVVAPTTPGYSWVKGRGLDEVLLAPMPAWVNEIFGR